MSTSVARRRLLNQRITGPRLRRPADVVAWCGAVQAQEYEAAKWGLGLRMQDGTSDVEIERAFERGQILRTHVMRPTWHFVTPKDARWMLELTAPRVHRAMSPYRRQLELDARSLTRGTRVIERALGNKEPLSRMELSEHLRRSGLIMVGPRLAHLMMYAELEGVICSGPRRGKKFTYALLAERAPHARRMTPDESLGELARRYFRSHGPATIRDFVWWSGLSTAEAKRGLEINRARRETVGGRHYWSIPPALRSAPHDNRIHLLPIYDEYLVAYRDREAVPHRPTVIVSASQWPVSFQHALVIDGQVTGTWRLAMRSASVSLGVTALRRLTTAERRRLADVCRRYERFRGMPVDCTFHSEYEAWRCVGLPPTCR